MRLPNLLLLLLLLCSLGPAGAQPTVDRVAYLRDQAIVVRNVEPTNEDYTDLAPLKQSLQQVRLNAFSNLGEQGFEIIVVPA